MTRLLVLLPLCIGLCAQAQRHGQDSSLIDYSNPQTYEIGGIIPGPNSNIQEDYLRRLSGLAIGQEIILPGDDIAKAIRKLWETQLFSSVECYIEKIHGTYVFLMFEVLPRPTICTYSIQNLTKAERDAIKEKLNLKAGSSLTRYDEQRIRNTISKYYVEKGYLFATTEFKITPADTCGPNTAKLDIIVEPGSKVRINDIVITGNVVVPERTLQRKMKETKEKSMINWAGVSGDTASRPFSPVRTLSNFSINNISAWAEDRIRLRLFKWSKYQEDKFKEDKKAIIAHYNALGYRDATFVSDSIVRLDDRNVNLYLTVSEGHRYYFRQITWEGNAKFKTEDLQRVLGITKGDVYDISRLDRKLFFDINTGDVSSLYMDRGHLFFDIRKEEILVGEDSIDLIIHVYEGPQAIINSVTISGNTKTSEHVIRRELRTLPGDYFSRANLIRSQREIAALGLFDPEQIGINPRPNPADGTVDIEFTVVEKPSDQLELSAGWGGVTGGLYGTAGIVFNNFSLRNVGKPKLWNPLPAGDGQQLSLRVQSNGLYYQSYTFSFVEPWLGGKKPNSFGLSSNYTLYNPRGRPRTDALASFIISRSSSVSMGWRLKWPDEYFQFNASLNFQNYYLHDYSGFVITNGNANNLHTRLTFQRRPTYLNPQYPTEGSSMSLTAQLTPPWSLLDPAIVGKSADERYKWIEYHKWRFNAEWYATLTRKQERKFVLKLAAKMGYVGYYNRDLGLSGFELFRVGGDGLSNISGYTLVGYDIISLRGTDDAVAPVGGTAANPSGNIFNKFTVELRYPFSTSAASTIFALAFFEGGNSYAGFKNYDPFDLRRSVGVGLRVFLPMFGLLGFDYGIGFDNPETQGLPLGELLSRGAFHFKIGFEPD